MTKEKFTKNDNKKPQLTLVEPDFIEGMAKVMTAGAEKYGKENWKLCKEPQRYKDALLHHVYAYLRGEKTDKESGFDHLDHAACNLMILKDLESKKVNHGESLKQAFFDLNHMIDLHNHKKKSKSPWFIGVDYSKEFSDSQVFTYHKENPVSCGYKPKEEDYIQSPTPGVFIKNTEEEKFFKKIKERDGFSCEPKAWRMINFTAILINVNKPIFLDREIDLSKSIGVSGKRYNLKETIETLLQGKISAKQLLISLVEQRGYLLDDITRRLGNRCEDISENYRITTSFVNEDKEVIEYHDQGKYFGKSIEAKINHYDNISFYENKEKPTGWGYRNSNKQDNIHNEKVKRYAETEPKQGVCRAFFAKTGTPREVNGKMKPTHAAECYELSNKQFQVTFKNIVTGKIIYHALDDFNLDLFLDFAAKNGFIRTTYYS